MKHYQVPGFSIALVDRDEVAWARGYGVCKVGCEAPLTPETVFQAAWKEGFHCLIGGVLETGQGFVWISNGANGNQLGFEVTQGLSKSIGRKWQAEAEDSRFVFSPG
jgi:hypothetical protein